jgi:hypothetical protein
MNKMFLLFFGFFLFHGINGTDVKGQDKANAGAYVRIVRPVNVVQASSSYSFSQNGSSNNPVSGNVFIISTDIVRVNAIPTIGSFSFTSNNKNTFSVSLPSHPVIIKNSENGNTLQLTGWQSPVKSGNGGGMQNNTWLINLDGSLKVGSVNNDKPGTYYGTYPITFVYN